MNESKISKLFEQVSLVLKETLPSVIIVQQASSEVDLSLSVSVPREKFKMSLDEIVSLGFTLKDDRFEAEAFCLLSGSVFDMNVAIRLVEISS